MSVTLEVPRTRTEMIDFIRRTRNWGRWGDDDQLGALNLITPEKRIAAAQLVRTGTALSLSRPFPSRPTANNRYPGVMYMERIVMPPDAGGSKDYQGMSYHGCTATHIDALCHTFDADGMWNGRDPDEQITVNGALWGSIDQWKTGILTRGVLLDIPGFRKEPYVTQDQPVHGTELAEVADSQGVEILPGDAVLIYCGREEYERHNPLWTSDLSIRPGLEADCLPFFRAVDCSAILWDMWDVRPSAFGMGFPVHSAIHAYGVAVVDAVLLEELAAVCAEGGRYDFMLSVNPLNVERATGSQVNPIVVF